MLSYLSISPDFINLGVVPVLVNTGAAALPAIMAALVSALAILFKPRELMRACRRRPWVPVLIVVIAVGGYFLFPLMGGSGSANSGSGDESNNTILAGGSDWDEVALEIIRSEGRRPKKNGQDNGNNGQTSNDSDSEQKPRIFRLNKNRSGYDGGDIPLQLELAWDYYPGNSTSAAVLSSSIVLDDRVFCTGTIMGPTTTYGMVFAVDVDSGDEIWLTDMVDESSDNAMKGFFSSPAITGDGKHLIIGQGLHADYDCELLCLNTETGEIEWTVPTPLHVESSPAIEGDIAVAGAGAIETPPNRKPSGDPEGRGHPGYLFAVQISTGEKLWRYQINDPEGSPVIEDGIVYAGAGINGRKVVALRTDSDKTLKENNQERLVWEVDAPYPVIGTMTLTEDMLLIGCGNSDYVYTADNPAGLVLALDPENGKELWRTEVGDSILGAIAVHNKTAVVPLRSALKDGQRSGQILALDLENEGKIIWRHTFQKGGMAMSGPVFTGSHVYAVSSNGYMAVIDGETGEGIEEHYINHASRPGERGLTISSPILVNGSLLVGSETGGLRAFEGREYK